MRDKFQTVATVRERERELQFRKNIVQQSDTHTHTYNLINKIVGADDSVCSNNQKQNKEPVSNIVGTRRALSENTGITLVALVITIIVLLILAGVALNMVMGDDGVIARAKIAKEKNNRASAIEAVQMAWMQVETDYQLSTDKTATRDQYFTKERVGEKLSGGKIAEDEENSFVYDENGVSQVIYENDNKDKYTVQIASNGTASIVEVSNVTGKDEFISSVHTVSIIEGENYAVKADGLTWTSTDDSKVTVVVSGDTATMTGIATGGAVVTGVNDNGTPAVTCTITVREAEDSFVSTKHQVQIVEGETYQLTSSSNLTWATTNSSIVSIAEATEGLKDIVTMTGNAEGSAKITGVNEKGTTVVECTIIVEASTSNTYIWNKYDAITEKIYAYKIGRIGTTVWIDNDIKNPTIMVGNNYVFNNRTGVFSLVDCSIRSVNTMAGYSCAASDEGKWLFGIPRFVSAYSGLYINTNNETTGCNLVMLGHKARAWSSGSNGYFNGFVGTVLTPYVAAINYKNSGNLNEKEQVVTSNDPTAYPSNGYQSETETDPETGNEVQKDYWYVLQGTE